MTTWPCKRCGIDRYANEQLVPLCADCRLVLNNTERRAWE